MDVVPLLLVFSVGLVIGAIVLFVFSVRQGDCHESERLCLMPLEDDTEGRPDDAAPRPNDTPEGR
jgi:hypothetical protein